MQSTEDMHFICQAVDAIWNRGDLAVADVLFGPTYVNHDGLIPDLVRGPEAIKLSVALYRTAFPDLTITINEFTAQGDTVRFRWTARGTRAPDHAAGATTAPRGTLTGTLTGRLVDGQLVESWVQWDRVGTLARLGLRPPPH